MSENSGDKVPIQEVYGVGLNKGNINTSKFAKTMTIYESQQQNLAEAARDIQELLEQLEKTFAECSAEQKVSRRSMSVLVFV